MAKGLGRGLDAFFRDHQQLSDEVEKISITKLRSNPYQPRKTFLQESIDELASSIATHGILQPLIVRKSIKGYEIVVGERRFKAAKRAGLKEVPAVVRHLTDEQMMEFALIENIQREDLDPIEEATAYVTLMEHLTLTQAEVAKRVGKSRPHVANLIRLLQLPKDVQQHISAGTLSMGHGRALLGLKNKRHLKPLLTKIMKEQLSVREVEQVVSKLNKSVSRETKKDPTPLSPFLKRQESMLRSHLGTSVKIKPGKKKGKIEIEYFSEEDLERIVQLFGIEEKI